MPINMRERNDEDELQLAGFAAREEDVNAMDNLQQTNQQELPQFLTENDVPIIKSQNDPSRMKLTKEEHQLALDIRDHIESMPDLDDLSDFMYAQLAIVLGKSHNNNNDAIMEEVIQRCYGMQEFRHEYKILDSFAQGSKSLCWGFELFPRQLLSFSFSEKDGTYVFAQDYEKFDSTQFTSGEMVDTWMTCMYYSHILFLPDFETIRKGWICIVECEGMGMNRGTLKHFKNFFDQFLSHYPMISKCLHYHTGTMVNVISSILRKFLPDDLKDQFQVGLQFDGHLGDAFLQPTVKEANARMLAAMEAALKRRYANEEAFSLVDDFSEKVSLED